MRCSTVTMIFLAASVVVALPIDPRQNPANNHLYEDGPEACPKGDADCEYLERADAYHTADEFSGHGGRQGEIVTHGTGKAVTDAGAPSVVGDADAKAGDTIENELFDTARKRGVLIDTFNKVGGTSGAMSGSDMVGGTVKSGGEDVQKSTKGGSKSEQDLGDTANAFGDEANYAIDTWGAGAAGHGPETDNAINNEVTKEDGGKDLNL